jgi:hypothetical protein
MAFSAQLDYLTERQSDFSSLDSVRRRVSGQIFDFQRQRWRGPQAGLRNFGISSP